MDGSGGWLMAILPFLLELRDAAFDEGLPPEVDVEVVELIDSLGGGHALVEAVGGDGQTGAVNA